MTDDLLPELRLRVHLDSYSSQPGVPSVVDADALLASVRNHCRNGWQSRISKIGEAGRWPLFASMHVYWEVYRGLPKLAVGTGLTANELRACYEAAYLPHISWVRVADGYGHDPRVAQITDLTDVPTGHLASLIAPCLVCAEDKSLRRPGFSSAQWRDAAGSAVTATESRSDQEGIVMLGGLPIVGATKGSIALSQRLQLPGSVGVVTVICAAVWALWPEERRRAVGKFFWPMVERFMRLEEAQRAALADLEPMVFQPGTDPPAKQKIATVLARASEPLLAAEIHDEIEYRFNGDAPPLAEVRRLLASEPEFVTNVRYRWQLGYRAAPVTDDVFAQLIS